MNLLLDNREIFPDGTVLHDDAAGIYALYHDINIQNMIFKPSLDIERFNKSNKLLDTQYSEIYTSNESLYTGMLWDTYWFTPEPWQSMDLGEWMISQCKTDAELERAAEELVKFEQYEMLPVLRHAIYLVDHFRKNKILWGVGRGSSVSSFLLYLTGLNRINPMLYDLNVDEFLKND